MLTIENGFQTDSKESTLTLKLVLNRPQGFVLVNKQSSWVFYVDSMSRVRLYWCESKTDIASRWIHRESNLMFTLSSDKDQSKKFAFPQCKWILNGSSTIEKRQHWRSVWMNPKRRTDLWLEGEGEVVVGGVGGEGELLRPVLVRWLGQVRHQSHHVVLQTQF